MPMEYKNLDSEEIRLRYLYRRLIRKKKVYLDMETAKKLVGPDTAYHLYQSHLSAEKKSGD